MYAVFYNVLERIKQKYPNLPMMLCSGGGGRCDYEALKYFTEFWPSDNTDAVERIFIQWGYSYFFPAKSMAAHVTSWGKQPVKFRTDVASMCKLGFDIRIHEMSQTDQQYCKEAVANFKRLMMLFWTVTNTVCSRLMKASMLLLCMPTTMQTKLFCLPSISIRDTQSRYNPFVYRA